MKYIKYSNKEDALELKLIHMNYIKTIYHIENFLSEITII